MSNKINTVLFDFDGTIMNTNDIILASWRHAFHEIIGTEPDESDLLDTFGEPIDDCVAKLLPGSDADEVKRVYRTYQYEHYEEMISLFPGILEVITKLHESGVKLAVVTNRMRNSTEIGLRQFGLDKLIELVVAVDDVEDNGMRAKPEPDAVFYALAKLGAKPENSMLVGDTLNDIISGNRAGVTTVRVGWAIAEDGDHDTAAAESLPDFFIDKPMEIITIMKGTEGGTE